jgi:uncharacterized membrane protein
MSLFLSVRVLHILFAAIWFGAAFAMIFFVVPALKDAGSAAGPVMGAINRRKYPAFIQSIAGLCVLTGFYLYYRHTGGFDPALSGTMSARVFGTGGIAGLVALIVGASVIGRAMKSIGTIMAQAAAMPDGAEKQALITKAQSLQASAAVWSKVVIVLMTIAIVTMSIGHYV